MTQQTFGQYIQVPVLRFATSATPSQGETEEVIAITVAAGKAYLFTLEAPSAAWAGAQATLEAIISSAVVNAELFPN